MIRIGIIEDDDAIRKILNEFFSAQPGFDCLVFANSIENFFENWNRDIYLDVLLCDIGLPGQSGIEGIGRIKKNVPRCQIIMLTVYDDADKIFQSLCAGATGYLLKQTPLLKIKEAVTSIYEGGAPMSPGIARKVVGYFNQRNAESLSEKLTLRERQVVQAIEEGFTNKEVAIRLNIGLETVKYHIKNIYQKLEVNSRHAIITGAYKSTKPGGNK